MAVPIREEGDGGKALAIKKNFFGTFFFSLLITFRLPFRLRVCGGGKKIFFAASLKRKK